MAPKRAVAKKDKRVPATRKLSRPGYWCGKCAVPKKGHMCPFANPVKNMRVVASETRVQRPRATYGSDDGIYLCGICMNIKKNHLCPGLVLVPEHLEETDVSCFISIQGQ